MAHFTSSSSCTLFRAGHLLIEMELVRASTELGKYAPKIIPQPNSDEILQKAEKIPYILVCDMPYVAQMELAA